MKQKHYRSSTLSLVFIAITSLNLFSQRLIESRRTSYYTYIYEITDDEAKKIYKNDISKTDPSFFHTLVDSFPTDSIYQKELPQGHYLKTYSEMNRQKVFITTVQDFSVFILNNNTDLVVQVYDLQGNLIREADVRVRLKKLRFNDRTKSYIDRKSNQKGLLKVTHNGFTAYYNLSRAYNNSFIRRGWRKVIYGSPVKYTWIPVNYVVRLPIDAVRSFRNGWWQPTGTIYQTGNFFRRSFEKIACLFDPYYCDSYKFQRKHTGYMVFNKPRYKPGDTVRFKAFIVKKNGKPVDEPVQVRLNTYWKTVTLTELQPYRDGGYEYAFFLHDSLKLKLDRSFTVSLVKSGNNKYISKSFRYEDYELSSINLSTRLDKNSHYRDTSVALWVKGTDENDLNLMDARLEVIIKPGNVNSYFRDRVFVPDTIRHFERELEPTGETKIVISDSLFPAANFEYSIEVRMITLDHEIATAREQASYFYEQKTFDIELIRDSMQVTYQENGIAKTVNTHIMARDHFGNETPVFNGETPCTIGLNPHYIAYIFRSDSVQEVIDISSQPSLLQCFSERTSDSLFITVNNPRNLHFNYTIYKRNNRKKAGHTDSLDLEQSTRTQQNYFISLRYIWGGEVKEENYRIPLMDKKLNIAVRQPKIVYPGQKTKIELTVTDINDEPVEGVDLTAYALTGKFDYSPPELPYLGKDRKDKKVINNFHFRDFALNTQQGLELDYQTWKILAGIDTIEYYKFLYPGDSIYYFSYPAADSITQFAPFVVSEGNIEPVHVIYVDHRPVYFSWTTNEQPYSFPVDSGYHHIEIRIHTKSITIPNLHFREGEKLIFSLNKDLETDSFTLSNEKSKLSKQEQSNLYRYTFPYRNNFANKFAYVEHLGKVQSLKPAYGNPSNEQYAGPVSGYLDFRVLGGYSLQFNHEPYFEYEFAPLLLKMRSQETDDYPKYLHSFQARESLSDWVYTEEKIIQNWRDYKEAQRWASAQYTFKRSTSPGAGQLRFYFQNSRYHNGRVPLNILAFKLDDPDFVQIYPGNISDMHQLDKGYYKLLFFYDGSRYHVQDSLYVQTGGLNHFIFDKPDTLLKDSFSIEVSELIQETIFQPRAYSLSREKTERQISNHHRQHFDYKGPGTIVEGYVSDIQEGEPLPGANVLVEGTSYGTITDMDGYYSLKVPDHYNRLTVNYVGYISETVPINNRNQINVQLAHDMMELQEVVVIGYGVHKKTDLTASVQTVTTRRFSSAAPGMESELAAALQGRVAGIDLNTDNNRLTSLQIRGGSSVDFEGNPLIIIDGRVYTGNISDLDPYWIKNIEVLKGASATAMYGAAAAHGVLLIEAKKGTFTSAMAQADKGATFDDAFYEEASQASSIRDNFADYAFWQPKLITNAEGKASFEVTFPDDVTSWEMYYLAMNGKRESGQTQNRVKSYKPFMAKLALPRFMVEGDSAVALGNVVNYTPDSMWVTRKYELNGEPQFNRTQYLVNSIIDSLPLTASGDSMQVKYFMEKGDGYYDGEKRDIPVFPKGMRETKGSFHALDNDTSLQLSYDTTLGAVTIYARADILEVLEDEIHHVINYRYNCNEQIASKLKAMLAEKKIAQYRGSEYKREHEIEKLIRLLRRNRNNSGLWGWWQNAVDSEWISLHVLEALIEAETMGYDTRIEKESIIDDMLWKLENSRNFHRRIRRLCILKLLDAHIDCRTYISDIEKDRDTTFIDLLQLMHLKQVCRMPYDLNSLKDYQEKTLFGNIYYSDGDRPYNLHINDIQHTLLVYKILKNDDGDHTQTLSKIRNYFLEQRQTGFWGNTYESIKIIEALLPDLLAGKTEMENPALRIASDSTYTVTEFPYQAQVSPADTLFITKTGDFPVYFTSYQQYWNGRPVVKKSDFEISSHFKNLDGTHLSAGTEATLVVNVKVKRDADYLMINIPIPGGCSYASKTNRTWGETHREHFRHETVIFCENLDQGDYTFEVDLLPRYTGSYSLNPAKVELMYFPTFNANEGMKRVRIE